MIFDAAAKRHTFLLAAGFLGLALLVGLPSPAKAQHLDIELWRLGNPRPITLADGTAVPSDPFANERFRLLMVDLGLAVHPTPAHPANTGGRAGTAFEIGLRIPQIHPSVVVGDTRPAGNPTGAIWVTRGTTSGRMPRQAVPDRLLLPMLQVRKGLPFSFEISSRMQYLTNSSTFAMNGGLRWALNEGFDFLPDLSVGGQVTRLVGTRDFGLTTASADVLLGKWFAIAGSMTVSPFLGWQRIWVSGVSAVVDFEPGSEAPGDPTRDDTVFAEVGIASNIYDRVTFGLRLRSYVGQILFEGCYKPAYLGLDPTMSFLVLVGLDF